MITHNTPAIQRQVFFSLAILYAINYNVSIHLPGKDIDPVNNCKCDKMCRRLIPDFAAFL